MGGALRIARGIDLVDGSSKSESTLSESEFEFEERDLLELGVRKDMAHCNDRCDRSSLGEHALTLRVTGNRTLMGSSCERQLEPLELVLRENAQPNAAQYTWTKLDLY